jgi:hypothetical protein
MSQEQDPAAFWRGWTKPEGPRGAGGPSEAGPAMPWHPLVAPAVAVWSQALAQAPGPEALEEWKRRLDEGLAAWSAALEKAMATEAFAGMLGRTLDRWLAQQGGVRRHAESAAELALGALGLPSRAQVAELASAQADLEDHLAAVEQRLEGLVRRLEDLFTALAERERATGPEARRAEGR